MVKSRIRSCLTLRALNIPPLVPLAQSCPPSPHRKLGKSIQQLHKEPKSPSSVAKQNTYSTLPPINELFGLLQKPTVAFSALPILRSICSSSCL